VRARRQAIASPIRGVLCNKVIVEGPATESTMMLPADWPASSLISSLSSVNLRVLHVGKDQMPSAFIRSMTSSVILMPCSMEVLPARTARSTPLAAGQRRVSQDPARVQRPPTRREVSCRPLFMKLCRSPWETPWKRDGRRGTGSTWQISGLDAYSTSLAR